jgi:hypothetical protein
MGGRGRGGGRYQMQGRKSPPNAIHKTVSPVSDMPSTSMPSTSIAEKEGTTIGNDMIRTGAE